MTITLTKKNYLHPEQERAGVITNASAILEGKTKMIITDVKSDSNSFSISINFFSKNKDNAHNVDMTSIVPENAVRSFSNGIGYAYLDTKDNREISLKYNNTDTFDYYYLALNPNTIDSEHHVILNVDFS
jgi:hypothetical protein